MPRKLTVALALQLCEARRKGLTVEAAAEHCRVPLSTLKTWRACADVSSVAFTFARAFDSAHESYRRQAQTQFDRALRAGLEDSVGV